ncbi:MAG: hypothetical protein CSA53_00700 [Gammaproteobacteria bacterium]|nr:MAG: hypothetical protein CSA53_00700 [Gammaproteobacteria bacterium]
MSATPHLSPDANSVLAKALLRAADDLGLNQSDIAQVLGVHRTAVSRIKSSGSLAVESKQGELALLLVRLARALYALTGGDRDWARYFMQSPNTGTGGIPKEQITSIQGLVNVLQFVDAIRGKL